MQNVLLFAPANLSEFEDKFFEQGYDTLAIILNMNENDMDGVGLSGDHKMELQAAQAPANAWACHAHYATTVLS